MRFVGSTVRLGGLVDAMREPLRVGTLLDEVDGEQDGARVRYLPQLATARAHPVNGADHQLARTHNRHLQKRTRYPRVARDRLEPGYASAWKP